MWRRLVCLLFIGVLLASMRLPAHAESPPHLGYGMMVAFPPKHLDYVRDAGFDWYKYFVYWHVVDSDHDRDYNWETVEWRLNEACEHGLNVLLRVERHSEDWTPITDAEMPAWEAFFEDLAAHIAQRRAACETPYRVALEVWNEPNLSFQWWDQPLNPSRYTEMVKRAYRGAKAADPRIIVVAGSLAPTGGTADGLAMDDVAFLEAMYAAGLKGHFDAISIHNYGFGGEPERKDYGSGILNFRRAEDIHAVMVAHGDGAKPVWGTEFGWLVAAPECDAYWDSIGFAWQQVSAAQQADYLCKAFDYADQNWPWMQVMIVSNLDFRMMKEWYQPCDPLRGFSILEEDGTPRPAYTALAQMVKRPRSWDAAGMAISPVALTWMMPLTETHTVSQTVTVHDTGDLPFEWTAASEAKELGVSLTPTQGLAGEAFIVTVDPRSLATGTYTATVTITADELTVPESPIVLPIRLSIVEHLYRAHLPLVRTGD
ncbi:MAG: cellulase family glycosylhydrolase [Anaerolineae bacterium]